MILRVCHNIIPTLYYIIFYMLTSRSYFFFLTIRNPIKLELYDVIIIFNGHRRLIINERVRRAYDDNMVYYIPKHEYKTRIFIPYYIIYIYIDRERELRYNIYLDQMCEHCRQTVVYTPCSLQYIILLYT